jgi:hypothetical protein
MSFLLALAIYYSLVCWVAAAFLRTDGMIHSNLEVAFAPAIFIYLPSKMLAETVLKKSRRFRPSGL